MSELPPALRGALERALEGRARADLASRARRASEAYRAGRASGGVIREADDALAYALTRLPATYAACTAVFDEALARAPDFAPRRLLDAGVGTAAASWAALEAWPQIRDAVWLDENRAFLDMAAQLAVDGGAALKAATPLRGDLAAGGPWPKADLVVASYAFAELSKAAQSHATANLWAASDGLLALIEPGTPAGYARILAARDQLIALGAEILAPCAHEAACPLTAPDWCHFSVRLPRSRDHRMAKGAEVPFEDERFIYLLAARPGVAKAPRPPRILAPPRAGKPGIDLKLCAPDGTLEARFVPRRDKAAYAAVRRLDWGDPLMTKA